MNKKLFFVIILCFALALVCGGLADGGTGADPAVSLSYINNVFVPQFRAEADEAISRGLSRAYNEAFASLAEQVGADNASAAAMDGSVRAGAGKTAFKRGDEVAASGVLKFVLLSGSARITGSVNAEDGSAVPQGADVQTGREYYAQSGGFAVTSDVAEAELDGGYRLSYSSAVDYTSAADVLYAMGLFRGRTDGYALPANATRAEGLVMFLRLIGEEQAALSYMGPQPFTDAGWADRYIAYAYSRGYTKGVSATRFGLNDRLSAAHYVTFLLRALGYTEGENFAWATVMDDSVKLGMLSAAERTSLQAVFTRAQVAYLSYRALFETLSGSEDSILTRLISQGVISEDTAFGALSSSRVTRIR